MDAFPLQWPAGYPRTERPEVGRFNTPLSVARDGLLDEMRLMGATDVVINSNMRYRNDGMPYARQGYIEDTGVVVYFMLDGEQMYFPCDTFRQVRDNVQALRKGVAALRGFERWGLKNMAKGVFVGLKALASGEPSKRPWWEVLGVDSNSDPSIVKKSYRRKLKVYHPDTAHDGGDHVKLDEVQAAWEAFNHG